MASYRVTVRGGSINIIYQHRDKIPLPIGLSIDPKKFTDIPDKWIQGDPIKNITIKGRLSELKEYVDEYFMRHKEYPAPAMLKGFFKQKPVENTELSFVQVWHRFIYDKAHRGNDSIGLNRARNIRTCLSLLLEFNPAIRLSDIDLKWYKKLLEYMHNEKGYTHNTIATNVKIIKVFIEWCRDTGIYAYDDKLASQMKQSFVTRDIMYHPIEELRRMMNADLSQHPHLIDTRDRYLLQCFTGLRVSDLMSADWQIGADYLKKVPVKTRKFGEVLTVPLRPEAKELVARILSKGEMRHISDQKYNEAIKQLGKVCGIDNDHTIVRGRRQFLAGARIKKYQFMTSHMARATFICQMIEAGVSERIIMKMTGIRNSRTLDHYAEVVDTTLTEVMNEVVKKQSKV